MAHPALMRQANHEGDVSDEYQIRTGSDQPIPDLRGRTMQLLSPYQGRTEVKVVELIGRNALQVPMYGCHLEGYESNGQPITVDFAASEFKGELGEAYVEQVKVSLLEIQAFLDGE